MIYRYMSMLGDIVESENRNKKYFTKKRDELVKEYWNNIIHQPRKMKKKNKKRANIDYSFYTQMIEWSAFNY